MKKKNKGGIYLKPVKLLELRSTYKGGGGPDKTILNSLKQHDKKKVEPFAIYIRGYEDLEFCIDKKAAKLNLKNYFDIKEKGKFDLKVFKYIRKFIIKNDIQIIHSHESKSNVYALLLKKSLYRLNPKIIVTAHAWVGQGKRADLIKKIDMKIIKKFDLILAVSSTLKDDMMNIGKISGKKIKVIHNAIDIEFWNKKRDAGSLKKELGLVQNFPIIGAVGRIMPEKDIITMLKTFYLVLKKFPKAKLILVGEPKHQLFEKEYKKFAKNLGISTNVIFYGASDNLIHLYNTFDIYLMTSIAEGLPNVLLEAMAMKIPIVSTNVAGVKELVIDQETGFICEQKDCKSLAERIIVIVKNPEIRVKFAKKGRKRIKEQFSFSNRLTKLELIYQSLTRDY